MSNLRHLFLDPAFLAESTGVTLATNSPIRKDLVIRPERAWEALMISFWVKVLEEEGRLRMWYICRDLHNRPHLAYAESTDGLNWEKPNLGLVEYEGSRDNNLLGIPNVDGAVFIDPMARTPEEKYVYVASTEHRRDVSGLARYTSPDGLRWKVDATALLPFRFDTQNVVFWDTNRLCYVLYLRGWDLSPGWDWRRRTVVRLETSSLHAPLPVVPSGLGDDPSGNPEKLPRVSGEIPCVFAADEYDPDNTDIYNMSTTPYPVDPRWYFAFPSIFERERNLSDGLLHVQVAGSTDGINWHRYLRQPYVPNGPEGSDSASMTFVGPGMIVRGDEIWQYGTSFGKRHGDLKARRAGADGVIHRFTQRIDGFVSAEFSPDGGRCLTAPVKVDGTRLWLNVKPRGSGEVRIGLRENNGATIPGFEAYRCAPITHDTPRAGVIWDGNFDLSLLAGRQVRVEFTGRDASLYAFLFSD